MTLILSFQVFSQGRFQWVGVNIESQTYFFPNIEGIFLDSFTQKAIRCDVSEQTITSYPLSQDFYDKGRTGCDNFISPEGEYGPYAHQVINHIKTYPYSENEFLKEKFPGMTDGLNICPNWKKLNIQQKFDFWVWAFASISWDESKCLPNRVNNRASDGIAVGLFQLNKSKKKRYWRGGSKRKACTVDNVMPDGANIECSVEIMHEILRGKQGEYKGNGALYGKQAASYWQSFRSDKQTDATKLLANFPPCMDQQK